MKHYKRFFALVLAGVLLMACAGCGGGSVGDGLHGSTRPEPSTVDIITDMNDPYSYIIKERYDLLFDESIYAYARYYALNDIDGDGTNELLLGYEAWDGKTNLLLVYAIQNGVAMRQEAFYTDPEYPVQSVILKNGTIRSSGENEGEAFLAYFRFVEGNLELLPGFVAAQANSETEYFLAEKGEKRPISKAEYDRVQKEMEGDGQVVRLDWKPLAEYGR